MRTCVFQNDCFLFSWRIRNPPRKRPRKRWLLKCTGLLKAWLIVTGVRLMVCGGCLLLNGSCGSRISALVPDSWHLFMSMCTVHENLLTHFSLRTFSRSPSHVFVPVQAHSIHSRGVCPDSGCGRGNDPARIRKDLTQVGPKAAVMAFTMPGALRSCTLAPSALRAARRRCHHREPRGQDRCRCSTSFSP